MNRLIVSGTCPDGTGRNGCGPQEQFRACADIRITEDGIAEETTPSTLTSTVKPRTRGTVTYRTRRPNKPTTSEPTTSTSTTSAEPTSTNATSSTNSGTISGDNPGPYVGIIIALATLLFAIAAISAVIIQFSYKLIKFTCETWVWLVFIYFEFVSGQLNLTESNKMKRSPNIFVRIQFI